MMNVFAVLALAGAVGLAGGAVGVYSLRRRAPITVQRGKPKRAPTRRIAG